MASKKVLEARCPTGKIAKMFGRFSLLGCLLYLGTAIIGIGSYALFFWGSELGPAYSVVIIMRRTELLRAAEAEEGALSGRPDKQKTLRSHGSAHEPWLFLFGQSSVAGSFFVFRIDGLLECRVYGWRSCSSARFYSVQRVGGSCHFLHKQLQEYLAKQPWASRSNGQQSKKRVVIPPMAC